MNLINRIFIFLFFIVTGSLYTISAQPQFDFPSGFGNEPPLNEVFDITPDGRRAAILTLSESDPTVGVQVTIIDPVTGVRLDSKITGRKQIAVKFAVLNDVIKVVVLTDNNNGNKYVTIYDMNENGLLTERFYTQLNNNPGVSSNGSNIVLSPAARTGFVSIASGNIRLVSFSLDTGNILHTLVTPVSEYLNIYESSARRFLIGGSNRTLVFIDYSNPSNLQEFGRVMLPSSGASFGTWQISTAISNDGQYVFAGNGFTLLTAINSSTRQIVGFLDNGRYRVRQLKIFESGNTRFLVMRGLEDGNNALKGFAVFNAADPLNLSVVNEVVYGESIFGANDFVISQNGKRFFAGGYGRLTAYSIPSLTQIWDIPFPQTFDPIKIAAFGNPERIFGAWRAIPASRIYSIPDFTNRISNFDLDGKTDVGVFRPANGTWYWLESNTNNFRAAQFGAAGDIPVAADYDGDDKTDLAVFRPVAANWYIFESSTNTARTLQFGTSGDTPIPADYDGDGKIDVAVFRRNPNRWVIGQSSSGQTKIHKFGYGKGKPVAGDFDGDKKSDFAFFNSTGVWQISNSNNTIINQQFGLPGDMPISGDFDVDGKNDLVVFRPSSGTWFIQRSFAGFRAVSFGLGTDKIVPADYDGDGRTDVAVFRSSNNTWYILQSSNGLIRAVQFGVGTDIPITLQN